MMKMMMKKLVFTILSSTLLLSSCGDKDKSGDESDEPKGPTLCDCITEEVQSEECAEMEVDWKAEYEAADEAGKAEMMQEIQDCMESQGEESMESDMDVENDPLAAAEAAEKICECMEPMMVLKDRAEGLQDMEDEEKATELMGEIQAAQSESMACIGALQAEYENRVSEQQLQEEIKNACPETAALMFGEE